MRLQLMGPNPLLDFQEMEMNGIWALAVTPAKPRSSARPSRDNNSAPSVSMYLVICTSYISNLPTSLISASYHYDQPTKTHNAKSTR